MRRACCYGNMDTVQARCTLCGGDVPEMNQSVLKMLQRVSFSVHAQKQHTTYCARGALAARDAGKTDAGQIQILACSGTFQTRFSGVTE